MLTDFARFYASLKSGPQIALLVLMFLIAGGALNLTRSFFKHVTADAPDTAEIGTYTVYVEDTAGNIRDNSFVTFRLPGGPIRKRTDPQTGHALISGVYQDHVQIFVDGDTDCKPLHQELTQPSTTVYLECSGDE